MRVLDLFSGVGGFSLGLERAGMQTVAFCEIEPFCRAVLRKHWPEVPIYEDIRTLTADVLERDGIAVDAICGGFPCQDLSAAGKRAGIDGERSGLWSEYARLIGELRPRYVIVENVAGILSSGIGRVLGDLSELGYDAEWHDIPASYVGAWHRRSRIWFLAYPNAKRGQQRLPQGPIFRQRHLFQQPSRGFARWPGRPNLPKSRICGRHDGIPDVVDRLKALGNAVVPQVVELIGRAIMEVSREQDS